jgi:hypothetical protein
MLETKQTILSDNIYQVSFCKLGPAFLKKDLMGVKIIKIHKGDLLI